MDHLKKVPYFPYLLSDIAKEIIEMYPDSSVLFDPKKKHVIVYYGDVFDESKFKERLNMLDGVKKVEFKFGEPVEDDDFVYVGKESIMSHIKLYDSFNLRVL